MLQLFRNLFPPKIEVRKDINYDDSKMKKAIQQNRRSLSFIDEWIDETAFKNSFFNYGIPDFIKLNINKPISDSITYSDILLYLSQKHFEKINYLEIGVSVGKNFFQLLAAHNHSQFTGFDIEEINPVLENYLSFSGKIEWPTPEQSIKKTNSSLKKYKFKGMEIDYLCADVWDENSWAKLKGQKFNIVFSDALHSPKAILFEFEMLLKYELMDEKFFIVWDDLVGKMRKSFFKIIKKYNRNFQIKDVYLLNVNGWVGANEGAHSVGIISNFSL